MTNTEQAIKDLRDAIKEDLIEQLRSWWEASKSSYEDADDAIEDALITLETA